MSLKTHEPIQCFFILCLGGIPANAANGTTLNICNRSLETLYFSVAHKQGDLVAGDTWKVQGVYDVAINSCLSLFQTEEQINAYLALVKVKEGQIVSYKGKFHASTNFAHNAKQDVCMAIKSFKYFIAKEDLGICDEGYFRVTSPIYLDIPANFSEKPTDHRVFIQ